MINRPAILAIDDTPENLLTLGAALGNDFKLQIATSGAMGLTLAAKSQPDLILLDAMMPEMDGFEVCRRLKADPQLKSVPVIFVTALTDTGAESAGLALGAADFITKPINVEIARHRIRNLVEREQLRKAAEEYSRELEKDIAERGRIEEMLKESELRYRTVADFTGDWEYWIMPDGAFRYMSPSCENISGYTREEFYADAELLTRIIHPDDLPFYTAHTHHFTAQGTPEPIDFRIRTKDGQYRWLSHVCRPVVDPAGQALGHRASNRDNTERKQVEEDLKRSNAELEQFSYAISHDMRQPLRMISSYLKLIENGLAGQLDGEQQEYFYFAIDGAKRLDGMLVGLLEYSRVGRKGEPRAWLESREVLDEALLFLGPAIEEAAATLKLDGDWPRVLASPDELLRLLQNLIGNALKFRIAGRTPEIAVTSTTAEKVWRVCIADNGIGMIPDQIGRLFQVFQRLHARTAYAGTGIGLALCRKIAEHHGGRIWAESAGEGQGSRFCFELPQEVTA